MLRSLLVLACLLCGTDAIAQNRPQLTATRDATVGYKTIGRDAGHTMQISYGATSGLMRIDNPHMNGYAIVDRKGRRVTMVVTDQQSYMDIPGTDLPRQLGVPEENVRFTRRRTEKIAGHRCTVWDFTAPAVKGSACVTNDGIMLRVRSNDGTGVEATKVSYAAVPSAHFAPPVGFSRMDIGSLAGPLGDPPGEDTGPPGR